MKLKPFALELTVDALGIYEIKQRKFFVRFVSKVERKLKAKPDWYVHKIYKGQSELERKIPKRN